MPRRSGWRRHTSSWPCSCVLSRGSPQRLGSAPLPTRPRSGQACSTCVRTSSAAPSRTPARVKKTKRAKKARGHQHPELVGLVLAALGIFLSTVVYLGWSGGPVGNWLENGVEAVVGGGVYAVPVALVVVGSLMLARSDLVDVRPFRMGVAVSTFSLLLALGPHGGFGGRALNGVFGTLLGDTGAAIAGGTGLVAGALLLSGASAGALLRRSGTAVRRTAGAARRSLDRGLLESCEQPSALPPPTRAEPPVGSAHEAPDVIGISPPAPMMP